MQTDLQAILDATMDVVVVFDSDRRFVSVNDLSVGRNVDEVVRTLDALQTDELCPCNWKPGEKTLQPA